MSMMKVLFLTNIPSPYRVNFFNELGKRCELTVLFERKGYVTRDRSWLDYEFKTFRGIISKGMEIGRYEKISTDIFRVIRKGAYDHIIVGNAAGITGVLAIAWMRMRKIPYAVEGDGGYAGSGRGVKERIKKYTIERAQLCFSTSGVHDEYYMRYGASEDRLRRYPFTSLREKDILRELPAEEEKSALKKSLGIMEKHCIISVGSYIHRKGMDILIRACEGLPEEWGLYIVGGTPTQEYLDLKAEMHLQQLHFVGFQSPESLKKYYLSADIFTLATREDIWGLVINEAMAGGLPVITTDKCVAGAELVEDGVNGYITAAEDVEGLRERLQALMEDGELRRRMALASLKKIGQYTFENMAEVHIEIMEEVCRQGAFR